MLSGRINESRIHLVPHLVGILYTASRAIYMLYNAADQKISITLHQGEIITCRFNQFHLIQKIEIDTISFHVFIDYYYSETMYSAM